MGSLERPLEILQLESSDKDARLVEQELLRGSVPCSIRRAATRQAYVEALDGRPPDVVVSCEAIPGLDGRRALSMARDRWPDVPFVFVAGEVGEETAAELVRRGGADFVLKNSLDRLVYRLYSAIKENGERLARRRKEDELRAREERYALSAIGSNDGIWDWDIGTNRIYFSPRWKAMFGYGESEIGDTPDEWFRFVHPDDLQRLEGQIMLHRQGITPHLQVEYRVLHKDGGFRWMLCRGMAVAGPDRWAQRIAGTQTDITDLRRAEEQLKRNAFYNSQTELPNRALFLDRVMWSLRRAQREPRQTFCVIVLNIDRFRVVSDSFGHATADELVVGVARRLEKCVRAGDTVAHFGADGFAVLLEDILEIGTALRIVERIQGEMRIPFPCGSDEIFVSASMGVVTGEHGSYERAEDILQDAYAAVDRAKAQGGDRFEIFGKDMRERLLARVKTEAEMRRALDRGEFVPYFQPVVSLASGEVTGCEALIRWKHPERGIVPPMEFIPLAEDTGLIVPIGEFMLKAVAAQVRSWAKGGLPPIPVAINLSARQLRERELCSVVTHALQEAEIVGSWLSLELTESAIMENPDQALVTLRALKELGIRLYMDDFGTGYSSLANLRRFPFDTLKIDRAFVRELDTKPDDVALVTAILAMARSLNLRVVAEGIEKREQQQVLKSLGCEEAQGFLYAKPIPAEEFARFVWGGAAREASQKPA